MIKGTSTIYPGYLKMVRNKKNRLKLLISKSLESIHVLKLRVEEYEQIYKLNDLDYDSIHEAVTTPTEVLMYKVSSESRKFNSKKSLLTSSADTLKEIIVALNGYFRLIKVQNEVDKNFIPAHQFSIFIFLTAFPVVCSTLTLFFLSVLFSSSRASLTTSRVEASSI